MTDNESYDNSGNEESKRVHSSVVNYACAGILVYFIFISGYCVRVLEESKRLSTSQTTAQTQPANRSTESDLRLILEEKSNGR